MIRTHLRWAMVGEVVAVALAFLGLVMVLHLCVGCPSPKTPTSEQAAAEAGYGAALLRCVDDARTLAESKACRAKVDAQWGVTQSAKDGGQ